MVIFQKSWRGDVDVSLVIDDADVDVDAGDGDGFISRAITIAMTPNTEHNTP